MFICRLLLCELIKLELSFSNLYFFSKFPAITRENNCLSRLDLHLDKLCRSCETRTSPNKRRFRTSVWLFFNVKRTLVLGVWNGLGTLSLFSLLRWHCFLYLAVRVTCLLYILSAFSNLRYTAAFCLLIFLLPRRCFSLGRVSATVTCWASSSTFFFCLYRSVFLRHCFLNRLCSRSDNSAIGLMLPFIFLLSRRAFSWARCNFIVVVFSSSM